MFFRSGRFGRFGRWFRRLLGLFFFRLFGGVNSLDRGVFFGDYAAIFGFPQAKKDKRNCGRGDVELGFASDFCFRFPAEELRGKKQCEDEPDGKREKNDEKCRRSGGRPASRKLSRSPRSTSSATA